MLHHPPQPADCGWLHAISRPRSNLRVIDWQFVAVKNFDVICSGTNTSRYYRLPDPPDIGLSRPSLRRIPLFESITRVTALGGRAR